MFRSVVAVIAGATLACLAGCALTPEPAAGEAGAGNVYNPGYYSGPAYRSGYSSGPSYGSGYGYGSSSGYSGSNYSSSSYSSSRDCPQRHKSDHHSSNAGGSVGDSIRAAAAAGAAGR